AFRLLLHGAAYNLVNFFRHHLPLPWRSAQIEALRENWRSDTPNRSLYPRSPRYQLALPEFVSLRRPPGQQQLTSSLPSEPTFPSSVLAEPCPKKCPAPFLPCLQHSPQLHLAAWMSLDRGKQSSHQKTQLS